MPALLFIATILFIACSSTYAVAYEKLQLWVHPYLPATELVKRFTPLAEYIEKKTGIPISVHISQSYQQHIQRVGENRFDLGYMGPAPYVKMTADYGSKPLLGRIEVNGKSFYSGVIAVRQDSSITSLSQVKREKLAFGDENSTMSHYVPCYMLHQAGVKVHHNYMGEFIRSHRDVALGVLGGYYDAGALKESVFLEYKERGLRAIASSPAIPTHLFVARDSMPIDLLAAVNRALLQLDSEKQKNKILQPIKQSITGIIPARDEEYDEVREIVTTVDGWGH